MFKLFIFFKNKNYRIILYNFYYCWKEKIRKFFVKVLLDFFKSNGYVLAPKKSIDDFFLREYKSYKEYKDVQVFHNKRKINKVFADKKTLTRVGNIIINEFKEKSQIKGLCHGSRNGFEQNFLREFSKKIDAIGTDISDTAKNYENSVHWDFHDINKDWENANHFIYTNSLDQSWQPKVALKTWLSQLTSDGLLIIEHTKSHSPSNASKSDPFGVRPTVMPYVLTLWFGSQISIEHTVAKKNNGSQMDAWLFVIRKNIKDVLLLN